MHKYVINHKCTNPSSTEAVKHLSLKYFQILFFSQFLDCFPMKLFLFTCCLVLVVKLPDSNKKLLISLKTFTGSQSKTFCNTVVASCSRLLQSCSHPPAVSTNLRQIQFIYKIISCTLCILAPIFFSCKCYFLDYLILL